MADTLEILSYLQANKERLSRDYHLTQIGLFGSMARGDERTDSDIDIAIEFEPNTPDLYSLKLNFKQEIQNKFNRPVDICRIKYIKPVFKNQILSEIKYV